MQLDINIAYKIARAAADYKIVCGNSDYTIKFTFDSEWDAHEVKTARFAFTRDGESKHIDVVFTGDICEMPVLSNITAVEIGVFAGDLRTTTPCMLACEKSIICREGAPEAPAEDVYNEITELCNKAVTTAKDVEERANAGEFDGEKGNSFTYDDMTEEEKADLLQDTYTKVETEKFLKEKSDINHTHAVAGNSVELPILLNESNTVAHEDNTEYAGYNENSISGYAESYDISVSGYIKLNISVDNNGSIKIDDNDRVVLDVSTSNKGVYTYEGEIKNKITVSVGMGVMTFHTFTKTEFAEKGFITKEQAKKLDEISDPIKYVESLDTEHLVNFRDLETGTYILHGYFSPYENSDISTSANNALVSVTRKDAGSHVICFNALNAVVVFMEILVDETQEKGYTYTRKNISLLELNDLIGKVETLETQVGDFDTALDELHNYAQALITGGNV